jgi:protein SCO1/2
VASAKVKVLLLIFILGMPVLIYLFLQGFGENQYEIPVLYQDGLEIPNQDCPDFKVPHRVDQIINEGPCENWNCSPIGQKMTLFSFASSDCQHHLSEIARVCNLFKDQEKFNSITIPLDDDVSNDMIASYLEQYPIKPDAWIWWTHDFYVNTIMSCGFNLSLDCSSIEQVVLVDQNAQIRGYYRIEETEELDRLVTEITILLKQENN